MTELRSVRRARVTAPAVIANALVLAIVVLMERRPT
jgi:hypothetical protein